MISWDDFDKLASSHGIALAVILVACVVLAYVVYRGGIWMVNSYEKRLAQAEIREERWNIVVADNKRLADNQENMAKLLDKIARGEGCLAPKPPR